MLVFFAISSLFAVRLAWLQLVQGRELAALAAKYHSRTVFYRWGHGSEGRGAILDRNLSPLTEANLQLGLAVFPSVGRDSTDYELWMDTLSQVTNLAREEIILRSSLRRPLPLSPTASAIACMGSQPVHIRKASTP